MKIIVTGGAGFIGSHIVEQLLAADHQPVVVDNFCTGQESNVPAGVTVHRIDICDQEALASMFAAEQPDAVCHQAAQMSVSDSVKSPSYDAQVNILGLINTLQEAQAVGVNRFVFASSGGVLYGDVTEPVTESYPANPISPYGISKWCGERYLQFFTAEHGLETVAMRYSNVYGPRQNPHGEAGVVAIFCQRLLRGESITVNGDGKYIRDYVHAADVARANVLALIKPLPATHTAFNIGTGIGTDVNQLAQILRTRCEQILQTTDPNTTVPPPLHGPARAGDLRSNLVDASLIKQTYGWQPSIGWQYGLEQTMNWFAEQAGFPAD